jgi:putative ABC transport system ATP-binding protein
LLPRWPLVRSGFMSEHRLLISDLSKTFGAGTGDEVVALDGFTLEVHGSRLTVVLGTNGSGKTTLLDLIAGAVRPSRGSVVIDGEDWTATKEYVRARSTGRLHQDTSLGVALSYTVRENLCFASAKGKRYSPFRRVTSASSVKSVSRVLAEHAPELLGRLAFPAASLSGGERQLLALMMVLLSAPAVLLLDEHTASLDPTNARRVLDLTRAVVQRQGTAAIMVTHMVDYAVEYGDLIVILHRGKTVANYARGAVDARQLVKVFYDLDRTAAHT